MKKCRSSESNPDISNITIYLHGNSDGCKLTYLIKCQDEQINFPTVKTCFFSKGEIFVGVNNNYLKIS